MTAYRSDEIELFNERAGIREFDGGLSRDIAERLAEEDVEAYRHKCEVDSIVRMYKTKGGDAVKSFLLQVEKHRGSETASRLREEALAQVRLGKVDSKQQR